MNVSVTTMDDCAEPLFHHVCVVSVSELIPHECVYVSNNEG